MMARRNEQSAKDKAKATAKESEEKKAAARRESENEAEVKAMKEAEKKDREQAALVRVALLTPPRQLLNRFKFGQLPRRTRGLPPDLGVGLFLLFPGALGDLLFLFAAGRRAREKWS